MPLYGLFDLIDKIKRYFKFTKEEMKALLISILIVAFIVSFKEWGYGSEFSFLIGIKNLIIAIFMVAIAIFVHNAGQRIAGLQVGFRVEYKLWWYGLLIGLIVVFVSRGSIWILAPGGIFMHHMASHRLGFFRYGTNLTAIGSVAFMGAVANILFATMIKILQVNLHLIAIDNVFFNKLFLINWAIAAYSLIPIPPLDGSRVFFASRLTLMFLFGCIGSYVLLILLFGIYSYIWALVIGVSVWFIYLTTFERKVWRPLG